MPENALRLDYNNLAEYMFSSLVELGYAPDGDEVLDITDIVYDFAIQLVASFGIPVVVIDEQEEFEEEE